MKTIVNSTLINSVLEIYSESFKDERGSFFNIFKSAEKEFYDFWKNREICQVNLSSNKRIGTIRGLHLQVGEFAEAKIITCLKGKVWDVAVDLRRSSETFGKWHATELNEDNEKAIFIPEGCAHGFQVLEENSELLYIHSNDWHPEGESGVRWDDKDLCISWPLESCYLNKKDKNLPTLLEF